MSGITDTETMSSTDALIWHIERDPLLRSTVMSVWMLERPPSPQRMRTTAERMAAELPRLGERVVDDGRRPKWVKTEHFDITDHYRFDDLGGNAEFDDVLARAQEWARQPFDRSRPLWQMGIFSGLADGRGALVLKLHHAIADGVGLMLMLEALADLEPNPEQRLRYDGGAVTGRPNRARRSVAATFGGVIPRVVRRPITSLRAAVRNIVSIIRLVMPNRRPLSSLMTGRSADRCLDVTTLPLATLRHAGRQAGGSLNDAFVSLVLDTLDRYHRRHQVLCDQVRVHMPISIRIAATADRAGNQFVPARIVMRIGGTDTEGRVRRVSKHLAAVRKEPALAWVNTVSATIQRLGVPISRRIIGGMMKGVDVLASNVAGPPCPVYLAGVHVEEFYAFGPPTGAALNVTLLSYDGTVHLGISTDAGAIASRQQFMSCLDEAIAEMETLASSVSRPPPDERETLGRPASRRPRPER